MKPATLFILLPLIFCLLLGTGAGKLFAADQSEQEFLRGLPEEFAENTLVHRLQAGEAIPEFTLKTMDGREISNATLKGKPALLAFFAIDNETRRERAYELLAALKKLREQYAGKVNVYGVCSDREGCESPEVKQAGGELKIIDDTQRVAYTLFGVFMMPTTMVLSAQGELLVNLPYSGEAQNALEGWLRVALGELTATQLQQQLTTKEPELTAEEKQALHHLQFARVLVQRRMYPQAVAEFAQASVLLPLSTEPLIEQGFVHLKLEQWAEAEQVFLQALERDKGSIPAVAGLGLALHQQGRDAEALLELEDAARVTKPMPRVLIALAEIYAGRGDKDLALNTYAKAFRQLARDLERCEQPGVADNE